jgi:hypothetical protein
MEKDKEIQGNSTLRATGSRKLTALLHGEEGADANNSSPFLRLFTSMCCFNSHKSHLLKLVPYTVKMEAIPSSERSDNTISTRRHIPQHGILDL